MRRLLAYALLLAACSGEREPPAPIAGRLAGTGSEGRYRFELVLDPPAPRLGERFAVETRIYDASGAPADAEVRLDATMPEHGHGMQTVPSHERVGIGTWRSEGLRFHMPGSWAFQIHAKGTAAEDTIDLRFEQPPR
ncbi:FixH family protein [Vulgatibacter sp.]|uniref:FixH family protein n=1 Tax=Vulgatibacter sp. TaxID=1971226 RepID=UPI003562782F